VAERLFPGFCLAGRELLHSPAVRCTSSDSEGAAQGLQHTRVLALLDGPLAVFLASVCVVGLQAGQ